MSFFQGPVTDMRSLNLIQWTLQLVALIVIYLSSYYQAASLSMSLAILLWSSIPAKMKTRIQLQYQQRIVKPKKKLLTEAEYLDQSRIETQKALTELRSFCKSPKCDAWKITSRLNSPTRFAEFVEGTFRKKNIYMKFGFEIVVMFLGASHLTQDEVMNYSHVDFEDESSLDEAALENDNDTNGVVEPPMTDDNSSDSEEIDLANPYANDANDTD